MRTIIENRASIIIYNLLLSNSFIGDTFILPSNICPIVPATILKAGKKVAFVDINNQTLLPSYQSILDLLGNQSNIAGILFSNTLGISHNHEAFYTELKERNPALFLIDDRCLQIPETDAHLTNADVVLYSTGYSKVLDFSKGGFAHVSETVKYQRLPLTYSSKDFKELQAQFQQVLKSKSKFHFKDGHWFGNPHKEINRETYFTEINSKLDELLAHKFRLNKIYQENISPPFIMGENLNQWRYSVKVNNKEDVLKKIFDAGLFASSHYQPVASIFGDGPETNAKYLHDVTINLFNDFRYDESKALETSKIINQYAR